MKKGRKKYGGKSRRKATEKKEKKEKIQHIKQKYYEEKRYR